MLHKDFIANLFNLILNLVFYLFLVHLLIVFFNLLLFYYCYNVHNIEVY